MAAASILLLGFAHLFVQSQKIDRNKSIALGAGGDKIFVPIAESNPAGEALQSALPGSHNTRRRMRR